MQELKALLKTVKDDRCSVLDRAMAGLALAKVGDPRPGVGIDENRVPQLAWSNWISGGTFLMGSSGDDPNALENEMPQHTARFHEFRIGLYPVTNLQFRMFVEATEGWADDRWWTTDGLAWRHEAAVWQQGEAPDNFPCVQVSWYAAAAFANWISSRLFAPANRRWMVRLPTEPEWERAARGTDGRLYPWGNDFDANRCNMRDSGIGSLCSVGIFPQGRSPARAFDMVGGTWEWCASLSRPYPYDARTEDPDAGGSRVIRGGSFNRDPSGVRCAVRREDPPHHVGGSVSFRVVCVPTSAQRDVLSLTRSPCPRAV